MFIKIVSSYVVIEVFNNWHTEYTQPWPAPNKMYPHYLGLVSLA